MRRSKQTQAGRGGRLFRLFGIICRASCTDRRRLVEAVFFLLAARIALACLPSKWLLSWCSRRITAPEITGPTRRRECIEVRTAILCVAPHLPGKTLCFPRSIAAQTILRRRRIGTVLYYGAAVRPESRLLASADSRLLAHVWLQDEDTGVIGYRAAGQYRVLACYPGS